MSKILKPHQISVNPEKVLVGNIELLQETQKESIVDFQSTTYNDDGSSNQNNLARYIDQDDDSLTIEDLVEIDDEELNTTTNDLSDKTPLNSSPEPEEDVEQPIDVHAGNVDQDADQVENNTHSDVKDDTTTTDSERTNASEEKEVSTSNDELTIVNQRLQAALQELNETKQQMASLQKDREQERIADLQQKEQHHKAEQQELEQERQSIIDAANTESEEILVAARADVKKIHQEAYDNGYEEGFANGYKQIESVVARLQEIIGKVVQRRQEILLSAEKQMVEMVLLIARKVVKVLTEENKQIVVENVRRALELAQKKGEVIIRINPTDLHLNAESLKKITATIERDEKINFIEDSSIEEGGCLIETEFGEIDARIQSQMLAIENKIRT